MAEHQVVQALLQVLSKGENIGQRLASKIDSRRTKFQGVFPEGTTKATRMTRAILLRQSAKSRKASSFLIGKTAYVLKRGERRMFLIIYNPGRSTRSVVDTLRKYVHGTLVIRVVPRNAMMSLPLSALHFLMNGDHSIYARSRARVISKTKAQRCLGKFLLGFVNLTPEGPSPLLMKWWMMLRKRYHLDVYFDAYGRTSLFDLARKGFGIARPPLCKLVYQYVRPGMKQVGVWPRTIAGRVRTPDC